MIHKFFSIFIALALTQAIVSSSVNNNRVQKLFDTMPWFVVEKHQDDDKNNSSSVLDDSDRSLKPSSQTPTTTTTKNLYKNNENLPNICQTKNCKAAAENFLTNMDSTIDPCDDFFGYACGGWQIAHPLPPTESTWDQFTSRNKILSQQLREILEENIDIADLGAVKNAKRAYKACMNTAAIEKRGVEPILSIIEKNGGWPIIMDASRRSQANKLTWQQIQENYSREYGSDSIYGISVEVDLKNASKYSIYLDQPSTILPRSMIMDEEISSGLISDYAKYVEAVAASFVETRKSNVPRIRIAKDARAIVDFEKEIAKISSPDEMRRDFNRLYNLMTIRRVQKWYNRGQPKTTKSKINWLKTIQNQFNDLKLNIELTENIVVMEVDYYFKLAALLDQTPTRTIVNYVHWRLIHSLIPSTTKPMRDITFEMERAVFGVQEQKERWMVCVNGHRMKHALSYQYVNRFGTDVAKNSVSKMVSEMQVEFEEQISQSTWMDEPTKIAAIDKLNSMRRFISHPDWYQNQTAMIHFYKGLLITQDHFENTINADRHEQRKKLQKYKTPVEQESWTTAPVTINAYYDPSMNSLTFPAGILQAPFFSETVPDALNYGSIGAVIGHEISHGFDDVGRQFDKSGNAKQWWSDNTIKAFTKKAQCFIDQYNNYRIEEISTKSKVYYANGELNQGENIADATGIQASYEIFKRISKAKNSKDVLLLAGLESFTQDQLFFISYGNTWCETVTKEYLTFLANSDAHPTNRLRVMGTLGNSEGFTKAFNCPEGSRMNRPQKCNLWK